MYHLIVHLPVNLCRDFTFSSPQPLPEGCRVLVTFNRKDMVGISGKPCPKPDNVRFTIKPVLEALDSAPVLSPLQMELAHWMADYYHCSVGTACFAMLPALMVPDVDAQLKWTGIDDKEEFSALADLLADGDFHYLSELRKRAKSLPLLRMVEQAAAQELIEVRRKISPRDKPKVVNYVRLLEPDHDASGLPARQRDVFDFVKAQTGDVPLSVLSDFVSYSVIKALCSKEILQIYPRRVKRDFAFYDAPSNPKRIVLNSEQLQAVETIGRGHGRFGVDLLFGITGSGKTEVYIHIIRKYLDEGGSILFLIPEIALTPQMVERFQSEFGDVLAISHSQLSDRERLLQWQTIAQGRCKIIIGARSAVFAPVRNLGLVVVDEEHEQSYRQDNNPRYNGRDLAIVRAKLEGAQVILGSATPALESWYNQQQGKYRIHYLRSRPLDIKLPQVNIINLCEEPGTEFLTSDLVAAINARIERREQVILFQNRRGFSSYLQCIKCGELIKCPNCEISMYYHRDLEQMHCHYCGYTVPTPRRCPHCGSFSFSYGAPGTQKVEELLHLVFPQAKILRLDSDSARKPDSYKTMYSRMKNREVDILLGTQMISKGLDFPGVTLVGIVNADISLNVPDFRAAERTFQLITQVAGRSGRGDKAGEVIVQTYNPEHYAIVHASRQDYVGFAGEELSYRERLFYPPVYRLGRLLFQSSNATQLESIMSALREYIKNRYPQGRTLDHILLGPTPAPYAKLNNLHRQHLIIKARTAGLMHELIAAITAGFVVPSGIQTVIEVDPLSLM
jgi:primosomal protein N' (replication factor Y)